MIVTLAQLVEKQRQWSAEGKKVVFTNGCFDILHLGHIRYLNQARSLGDLLVLGLNSDASVRRLKGAKRPLVPQDERAEVMDGLKAIDYVVIFEDLTAENIVSALKPDIYVKGGDYSLNESGKSLPEAAIVQNYGGKVEFIPFVAGHSTTDLIKKILTIYAN
jgi:rfaE bifunctional protein nucleotidyltransferase chain/domain